MNIRKINIQKTMFKNDNISKANNIHFKSADDVFIKRNSTVLDIYGTDDTTIYAKFKPKNSNHKLCADLLNYDEPPYNLEGKEVNCQLSMCFCSVEKVDNSTQDFIEQTTKSVISSNTTVVGRIYNINQPNEGYVQIEVENFDIPITILARKLNNIKIGDKIKAEGILDCELTEV